jgi:hypothetical protein
MRRVCQIPSRERTLWTPKLSMSASEYEALPNANALMEAVNPGAAPILPADVTEAHIMALSHAYERDFHAFLTIKPTDNALKQRLMLAPPLTYLEHIEDESTSAGHTTANKTNSEDNPSTPAPVWQYCWSHGLNKSHGSIAGINTKERHVYDVTLNNPFNG